MPMRMISPQRQQTVAFDPRLEAIAVMSSIERNADPSPPRLPHLGTATTFSFGLIDAARTRLPQKRLRAQLVVREKSGSRLDREVPVEIGVGSLPDDPMPPRRCRAGH